MQLTEKETKAFTHIINESLSGMGGTEPKHLHEDNYSWHNHKDIMEAGFTMNQSKGLLSSLEGKGLIQYGDTTDYGDLYFVTEEGIDLAQEIMR